MAKARVGVIGGTGLYRIEGLTNISEVKIRTPFGPTSDSIMLGKLSGIGVAFLPRHGRGHRIDPTDLPARANIYAMKTLGVERIISVNAVGSLKEEIKPLDIVIPNQLIDRTRNRPNTFFGNGIVAHVAFADPFCEILRQDLHRAAQQEEAAAHIDSTLIVIEGPQFSTRAESNLYRSWNADIIGMTALPEAKLAREAEICYSILALTTDYDCWHLVEEEVSVEMVMASLAKNIALSKRILERVIPKIPQTRDCGCASALENAIVTSREHIPAGVMKDLAPIISKYV